MYYCFHSCFFKTAASCRQHCWVVGTGGWWLFSYLLGGNSRNWVVWGQLSWGLAHCMANTDPIFWSALQHSIQLDNKYQIRQRHGSRGGFTNYNLFCSLWKTCLDGDQHVHTLSHTPYNNTPSLSVDVAFRRLWRVGRRRKLPYHKRPWDIHLKFSIILFIRGWVSQSWGSQSNFSL